MKFRLAPFALLAALLLALPVVSRADDVAVPAVQPEPAPISQIEVETYPGYVMRPYAVYKVTFNSDGSAVWTTGTTADTHLMAGHIRLDFFKRLADLLDDQKFFDMPDSYAPKPMIEDGGGVYVRAVRGDTHKQINDYFGAAPRSLWAIEMVVRGLVAQTTWQDVTANAKSGVRGIVIAGPHYDATNPAPLMAQAVQPDMPKPGVIIAAIDANGKEAGRATSDAQGKFQIALPAGDYILEQVFIGNAKHTGGAKPQKITVKENEWLDVTVDYDTGLQ